MTSGCRRRPPCTGAGHLLKVPHQIEVLSGDLEALLEVDVLVECVLDIVEQLQLPGLVAFVSGLGGRRGRFHAGLDRANQGRPA